MPKNTARRAAAVSLAVAVAVFGWTSACARPGSVTRGGSSPAVSASATGEQTVFTETERAAIYLAVLRRYLTTSDHSFGADHRFPIVYVLDRTDAQAGEPLPGDPRNGGPGSMPVLEEITSDDQAAIRTGLADVGPVEFVRDRTSVVDKVNDCAQVRGGGVLITLAPPRAARPQRGDTAPMDLPRVHVGINGYVACLGATWFTYVVQGAPGGWQVTGTTGPMAIA